MSVMRQRADRPPPDELVGPWPCRSGDCEDEAVFYVDMPATWKHQDRVGRRAIIRDAWDGHFCRVHLVRVLELKLDEVPYGVTLRIRRIM